MPDNNIRGNVEHGEGGKFEDKYDDDDVVHALAEAYPEPLTNQEVADRIGCAKATAHNRLHELEEDGIVHTKQPGARARVWWVDMTQPAPEANGATIRDRLQDDRDLTIEVASSFNPPFNPTRTGTEEMLDFIMQQPWGDVNRAIDRALGGDDDAN